jgi:hypothetical protein
MNVNANEVRKERPVPSTVVGPILFKFRPEPNPAIFHSNPQYYYGKDDLKISHGSFASHHFRPIVKPFSQPGYLVGS